MDGDSATIHPRLLNPADLVEIQCLLDGNLDDEDLIVDCRVVGVPSVERVRLSKDSWGKVWRASKLEALISIGVPLLLATQGTVALFVANSRRAVIADGFLFGLRCCSVCVLSAMFVVVGCG